MTTLHDGVAAEVAGDYAKALQIFRELAEKGNVDAWLAIGELYFRGKGVPQDFKEAVTWYRLAAEQGNAVAQANLGRCYSQGKGVGRDDQEAYFWLNLAASKNPRHIEDRNRAAAALTPEEFEEVQARCTEWAKQLELRFQLRARRSRKSRLG